MQGLGVRVVVVGSAEELGELEGIALDPVDGDAFPEGVEHDVAILDRRAFASDEALLRARAEYRGRVLVVADPETAAGVLAGLHPDDDVSMRGEPHALLLHRLRRIVGPRDALTGLARRPAWQRELERALAEASAQRPASIVLLDVDRFKAVNDEHGHAKGDAILAGLAARLTTACPQARVIARLGGELFGVLTVASEADATEQAEAILEAVRAAPIEDVSITWSAGVATTSEPIGSRELVRLADQALYSAKARGRDRVVHASVSLRKSELAGTDAQLESFEDFTHVIAERVAEVIARRGRRLFAELREQADMDALTALFSRRYLDRRLPFEVDQSQSASLPLTVALLDIDHFGQVNKQHGWPTGDKVLAAVAETVRETVRATDWVARYGGEELCIVLADTPIESARSVLERIRAAIEALRVTSADGSATIEVTVSAGAAERRDGEPVEALVERASDRLLGAKAAGRNCVRI